MRDVDYAPCLDHPKSMIMASPYDRRSYSRRNSGRFSVSGDGIDVVSRIGALSCECETGLDRL